MSFSLRLALRGDLRRATQADIKAGQKAVTSVVRRKTKQVKKNIRKEVESAGLGSRLAKAVRGNAYPRRGASFEARGTVHSNALVKGGRPEFRDLITVFTEGARIRPRSGKFLAIPARDLSGRLRRAEKRGSPAKTPEDFQDAGVDLIFLPNPPRLVSRKAPDIIAFWLVRQTRLRPRIDPASRYDRAMTNFLDLIVRKWERDSQRAFDRLT